ncbi:hypothetical protein JTB14_020877 [Gonioctena quinquepunctata]|nr:hypothetical protein JTB14_020877 [Gonioctena quinquepunctata]
MKVQINKIILGEGADALAQQPREVGGDISLAKLALLRRKQSPRSSRGSSSALRKTQRTTGHATQRESLMGKTMKLIQANLQHAKSASYTISRRFTNELLDVVLIQEPWTTGPGRIKYSW